MEAEFTDKKPTEQPDPKPAKAKKITSPGKPKRYVPTGVAVSIEIRDDMEAIARVKEWKISHVGRKFFEACWADYLNANPELKGTVEAARAARAERKQAAQN